MLMLSGGIDSPVAGYLAIKRGVKLECVYYESPPHTSPEAKNKAVELARKLAVYNNDVKLHVIKFTDIQTAIYQNCPHEYLITIMRRMMYRISAIIAARSNAKILVNGEENFTEDSLNTIFGKEFFVYIPKTNKTITKVNLELSYSDYETDASLWKNDTTNESGEEVYQPVTLVTRKITPHKVNKVYDIDRRTEDLALRKYIVKVNDEVVNRTPEVDVTGLKNGTSTTAIYKHAKNPVKVISPSQTAKREEPSGAGIDTFTVPSG